MAKQVIIELTDDIDGSVISDNDGESIDFSVDGVDYTIDLKSKNAIEFHRTFSYYTDLATRVGGRKRRSSPVAADKPLADSIPATRDPAQTGQFESGRTPTATTSVRVVEYLQL